VPAELLALINRALAKDPERRFASTRDMRAAIEAVPFSEADRRQSEEVLRNLAEGVDVATVPTRDMPAVPDARTMALRLGMPRRRRAVAQVATGQVVVLGTAIVAVARRNGTPAAAPDTAQALALTAGPPPDTASLRPPAPRVASGTLRILTTPPDAEILIDGRRAGVGSVIDRAVPVGQRRIQARAPGYASYDTIVEVRAGALVNLRRVTLRAVGDGP
jgi:hypothetical protein